MSLKFIHKVQVLLQWRSLETLNQGLLKPNLSKSFLKNYFENRRRLDKAKQLTRIFKKLHPNPRKFLQIVTEKASAGMVFVTGSLKGMMPAFTKIHSKGRYISKKKQISFINPVVINAIESRKEVYTATPHYFVQCNLEMSFS